jgi:ABC-type phosphate transport system substrate-binding protein
MLLYENPENKEHARVMSDFMKWALSSGQPLAETLGYARLPEALVPMELEQLNRVNVQ